MTERLDSQSPADKPRVSDTPQTDALVGLPGPERHKALWDLCAQLERSLAAAERRLTAQSAGTASTDLYQRLVEAIDTALVKGTEEAERRMRDVLDEVRMVLQTPHSATGEIIKACRDIHVYGATPEVVGRIVAALSAYDNR